MSNNFHIPPTGFGPGSQPPGEDGEELSYMQMPQDMRTFYASTPEVPDGVDLSPALDLLQKVADAAKLAGEGGARATFDLTGLDRANRALIAETMGEGEVSIKILGIPAIAAQESVFAGVWVLSGSGVDQIEVATVPALALERAFVAAEPAIGMLAPKPKGLVNAPSILVELQDKSAGWSESDEVHVINLSLLPHSEADIEWLGTALGKGSVQVLSRGYGNCRIEATGQAHVWKVQFFNSMDTLILDTFEVTQMPEVALAAPEDLSDSGGRIIEVMEAIR